MIATVSSLFIEESRAPIEWSTGSPCLMFLHQRWNSWTAHFTSTSSQLLPFLSLSSRPTEPVRRFPRARRLSGGFHGPARKLFTAIPRTICLIRSRDGKQRRFSTGRFPFLPVATLVTDDDATKRLSLSPRIWNHGRASIFFRFGYRNTRIDSAKGAENLDHQHRMALFMMPTSTAYLSSSGVLLDPLIFRVHGTLAVDSGSDFGPRNEHDVFFHCAQLIFHGKFSYGV